MSFMNIESVEGAVGSAMPISTNENRSDHESDEEALSQLPPDLSEHLAGELDGEHSHGSTHSESHFDAEKALEHSKNLIDNPNLKLNMPDALDHENFSKLLELDSKNDDDLFSSADLLEHDIPEDLSKLVDESTKVLHDTVREDHSIASPSSGKELSESIHQSASELQHSQNQSERSPHSREDSAHSSNNLHFEAKDAISSLPDDSVALTKDLYNSGTLSAGAGTREDTPTSIFEAKDEGDFEEHTKQETLSPSHFQPMSLPPPPLPENAVNKHPPPPPPPPPVNDLNSQVAMTEFQDPTTNDSEQSKISAYARLDFQSFTFYVQTLQVIIGRRSENDFTHKVDVNLGPSKSISRRHAQIFYNFGTGRFELSIMGKNGAFVDDAFVERGITVQLKNRAKVQIGQIPFQFVLPEQEGKEKKVTAPADAIPVKTPLSSSNKIAELSRSSPSSALLAGNEQNVPKQEETEVPALKKKLPPKKKEKKEAKPPKPPKKVYTLDEIPVEYRSKPAGSYSNLITACLRKYSSAKGMSLSGIYAGIRELFPYYKYCPDGWQSSVRHNLSLNKSFRKVSKEGKGWLWGLNEEYIAEREKQKKKQAEAAALKAKAAQLKLEQQQQQKAKRPSPGDSSSSKSISSVQIMNTKPRQPNISQTLAANRADRKATADGNQRTMKYLQEQLMVLTKDRKGLDKQVMASILTQALAMTINQVTQAAKSKGITGNPLTALIDKNPQHLNLILAAAVNAATIKVTNGSVKQLVSMPPPTASNVNSESTSSSVPINSPSASIPSRPPVPSSQQQGQSSESFDPSSLSKFFQPKQPSRVATPNPPRSVIPQKRASSETESSSGEESSSEDGSDTEGSDDSDSSDSSDNEDSSSGKDSSSEEGSSDGE
ncbi:LAME_0A05952g1_1 [Lachancea meyersii CBS 8951]|uniref:LAME_0A05952g1_1 n=1 Tax=Lachancea meyersii CBS 8951 TaxID=1266667 RepID=A0A1G4IQ22_9SACH|nr:LAME_0A05952g1_1 [Lachancea meyersii CBS 8951]